MHTAPYLDQKARWPKSGRHILAQFDEQNIVVYQAFRPSTGRDAVAKQQFDLGFSYRRMSWIKPNFLWMMYRSGWGTKEGQETTLALTISRAFFDELLSLAVPSTFSPMTYPDETAWKRAVSSSEVRLQWDPDHAPDGSPQKRKAVQLGLRGDILRRYGRGEIISIKDISDFVAEQRGNLSAAWDRLETPMEDVYLPRLEGAAENIGLEMID